jgi:hypothetical protein
VLTTRLKVTLRDVEPAVIRVLDVPVSTTLPELHDVLQVAMGWTDSHLHQFLAGDQRWGVPDGEWDDSGELDESGIKLKALPTEFVYLYDFGDSWEHDVEVLGMGGDEPRLVYGEGACPPEDCGGVPGYEELQQALADPSHPEHQHMRGWSSHHSFTFDQDTTDTLVRRTVGTVPESVRVVLDVVGTGLKLTQAGKFPPAVVAELQERLPHWHPLIGAVREDNLREASCLRELLCEVGVLRKNRGMLLPTKACTDDLEIVRRLRKRFPDRDFDTLLITNVAAVLQAHGPLPIPELLGHVLPMMGSRWRVGDRPLDATVLQDSFWYVSELMVCLDLVVIDRRHRLVSPGASAVSLLPRTTGLAPLLQA